MSSYQRILIFIILAIILEIVSPVPLLLTFGTMFILFFKPKWFLKFVLEFYGDENIEEKERMIIDCARSLNNRVTVTELASMTRLTLSEAEDWLNSFEVSGRISSEISDEGVIIYNFNEIMFQKEIKNQ